MSIKKATLKEIIAKKKQGEMDKLQVKYYDSETLGMPIEIKKLKLKKYMSIIESLEDEESIDGMNKIIYEFCPMFKENTKEAMKEYGVDEPTNLPSAVLEDQLNEMQAICEIINSFYGLDKVDAETVKN
ncbi:hypothetical protein [Wukongibacter sp. M2B1]|uniref:hypothetical protein n=1 Tax=Wukongibacter sp. M2B1 TaxID=3088895 RepID=UPI003D79C888